MSFISLFSSRLQQLFTTPQQDGIYHYQDQTPITSLPYDMLDVIQGTGLGSNDINALAASCKTLKRWKLHNISKDSKRLSTYLQKISHMYSPPALEQALSQFPETPCQTPYDFTCHRGDACDSAIFAIIAKKFPNMRTFSYTREGMTTLGTIAKVAVYAVAVLVLPLVSLEICGNLLFHKLKYIFPCFDTIKPKFILWPKIDRLITAVFCHDPVLSLIGVAFPQLQRLQITLASSSGTVSFEGAVIPDAKEICISYDFFSHRHFYFSNHSKLKSLTLDSCPAGLSSKITFPPSETDFPPQLEKLTIQINTCSEELLKNIFTQCPNLKSLILSYRSGPQHIEIPTTHPNLALTVNKL